jgi:decaprenylphospho-beta-D-erythro-pentofuranosid-2-ulose 2-reductase
MTKVLIIGAGSAIAEATARCFAADGGTLHLIGRKPERLEVISQDLRVRGAAAVTVGVLDVDALTAHAAALDAAEQVLGGIDVALIAHGTLPDQPECAASTEVALREFHTNAVATIALMNALAQRLERQGQGTLAVISSVAGDRGRQSNYLYGSAKAAVSTYAAGLRNRLSPRGIQVVTIKPGFVDTPMTKDFPKGALWAQPQDVAKGIVHAIDKGRSEVYLPWFWFFIMLVIRNVPEFLFKRVKL